MNREKVIYDCNIHLQRLLNPDGPGGACIRLAMAGDVELVISNYILDELRDLSTRPALRRAGISEQAVEGHISELSRNCTLVTHVPLIFEHPIDRDDSHYVNLAIATEAKLIVSRDRHLLGLMDVTKPWSADFRQRFAAIRILTAEEFLRKIEQAGEPSV